MGVPQNGWFITIMEDPIKMDDLGVQYPHFRKPPNWISVAG
jgi:hypothetical protein